LKHSLFDTPPNKPLQTGERRVLVSAKLQMTLAPLAADRQAVRRLPKPEGPRINML